MSVDTKVRLIGRVDAESIAEWIKTNVDKDVKLVNGTVTRITEAEYDKYVSTGDIKEHYSEDKTLWSIAKWINFTHNGRKRIIFYHYSPLNWYENLDYYKPLGLEEMVKSETTNLSLGCDDDAKNIMEKIVKAFGGWIDYNDCDDEEFIKFEKDSESPITVRHITMADVYEAFGGFVVIDDLYKN